MAELMRNPEIMKRAQNEVRSLMENKQKVEESDLDKLHHLKSVIKETMKLQPPAPPPLVQRQTMQHCKINDYDVASKTRLFINAWAIGRNPDVWERADEFWPERFMNRSIDFRGHDFQLIPFGAGGRMCPGLNAGILIVELALTNFLYVFDWELSNGMSKEDIDMGEAPGVTVKRKSPLRLVAKKFIDVKG